MRLREIEIISGENPRNPSKVLLFSLSFPSEIRGKESKLIGDRLHFFPNPAIAISCWDTQRSSKSKGPHQPAPTVLSQHMPLVMAPDGCIITATQRPQKNKELLTDAGKMLCNSRCCGIDEMEALFPISRLS